MRAPGPLRANPRPRDRIDHQAAVEVHASGIADAPSIGRLLLARSYWDWFADDGNEAELFCKELTREIERRKRLRLR